MKRIIISLLIMSQLGSYGFAEKSIKEKIKEVETVFDTVKEFCELLKKAELKGIKKFLDEHEKEFKRIGLENLTELKEKEIKSAKKAIYAAIKKGLYKSMKPRKALFESKSGIKFEGKLQSIYRGNWWIIRQFNHYFSMDEEEFEKVKKEMLEDLQWEIIIHNEENVEFYDGFANRFTVSVDSYGKIIQPKAKVYQWILGKSKKPYNLSYLGIRIRTLKDDEKKKYNVKFGVIVKKVKEDSPAEEEGIKVNDIITHLDDKPIKKKSDLVKAIRKLIPGETVKFKVKRGEKFLVIEVDL